MVYNKTGSAVHFDVFQGSDIVPHSMWQVHCLHDKKRSVVSKEDYKKVTRHLNCTLEEFLEELKNI
ncbi:MAG: hypothetical protein NTU76_00205 [Candidatus Taylorbacteria bacterium]|nr:hypothetical protein [Candidatus Taylorbacteria bacterium]